MGTFVHKYLETRDVLQSSIISIGYYEYFFGLVLIRFHKSLGCIVDRYDEESSSFTRVLSY